MTRLKSAQNLPHYHGKSWVKMRLPRKSQDWSDGGQKSLAPDCTTPQKLQKTLRGLNQNNQWKWPKRRQFFFSDLHGDPDAFAASLVASGGVHKTGPNATDFKLTKTGQQANFIIGGDCFDKGPSSLNLLRTVRHLKKQGARVRVLAGNHDVRVLFGMISVGKKKDVLNEHFFIRTGQKIIPLLKEIWTEYLDGREVIRELPSKKKCKELLYPRESWFDDFPQAVGDTLNPWQVERELNRIRKKYNTFEAKCEKAGMNLRQVYGAVHKWKELFLEESGEFYWFFQQMRIAFKSGSFLFVHAGLDNEIANQIQREGVSSLNRDFRTALKNKPFESYYGPLCNTVRTKYRKVDHPFTNKGARAVRRAGISAIIHGHRNLHFGQRIALRNTVLNFECDTTLDSHSRQNEKVRGHGASVTIIEPTGRILGVSSDYPHVKVFDPIKTLKHLQKQQGKSA